MYICDDGLALQVKAFKEMIHLYELELIAVGNGCIPVCDIYLD